ncbi:GATA zinc finger domain-containing protein 14-like [Melanaphis sacchari]|uniref:GATA zinc finger domain-containing protein 14-like n=1 Tax=Melanaphis sacchari TaxID=742174 RepID=UPI000DC14510|nr:GATA zinc finger domain-containing protein 14-like [Melanaphis sacchari]
MKLLAVVVIGFVALAGSEAVSTHQHRDTQTDVERNIQGYSNDRYDQYNNNYGADQYQRRNEESNHHRSNNQESSNERFMDNQNQQNNQGLNEFSESNWNTPRRSMNMYNQHQLIRQDNQDKDENQWSRSQVSRNFNQQSQEELNQQITNNKNHASQNNGFSISSEENSQEDYIKDHHNNDISNEIGLQVAQKMVRFFTIFDKYAARNGSIQTNQAQESLTLRQHALPMNHEKYLNIDESNVYGLNYGVIKSIYLNTERNCVELEHFFQRLLVKAKFNANNGLKKSFDLNMFNTDVNVSTELENRNRNYAHSRNDNAQLECNNCEDSNDSQSIKETIENKYVQLLNTEIESEMIDNSYDGLVGCLRSEIESTFDMPSNNKLDLVIENKKTQLTVSLTKSHSWKDDQSRNQYNNKRTVQYVAFRHVSGNGYKLKVKIVLAKQPTWESDIVVQKSNQQININNVKFNAQNIVASAVMKREQQENGAYRFVVEESNIKLEGLRYDIGKFNLPNNTNEKLAREIGQNLQKIMENGMSAALRQQLYKQQQICKQRPMDCNSCSRSQLFNQQ